MLVQDAALWDAARLAAADGPVVAIPTLIGGHRLVGTVESMLAIALTLRGTRAELMLCDAALPACMQLEYQALDEPRRLVDRKFKRNICQDCVQTGERMFSPLGLPQSKLSRFITPHDREIALNATRDVSAAEAKEFVWRGLPVGEHALAGALRYYAKGTLEEEALGDAVIGRYLESGILTAIAIERWLDSIGEVASAVFNHGIYTPQGIVGAILRRRGIALANWVAAYRRNTVIFSHGDSYHHTMMNEPTSEWETMTWTPEMDAQLTTYLASRPQGDKDWIWFHEPEGTAFRAYTSETGLNPERPTVGILTSVFWDAQLHYPTNIFPDMRTWLLKTIEFFGRHPELQALVRIHPAELRGTIPSRQPMAAEIVKAFPRLPSNVFVIPPESPVNTYEAMAICDPVVVYNTKMGIELSALGKSVITAGEAWVRKKGISLDPLSQEAYFRLLEGVRPAGEVASDNLQRARKYAYHFFFRRMIPLPFLDQIGNEISVDICSLDDLLPGKWPGLDLLCEGVSSGGSFIYSAESLGLHDSER